MSGRLTTGAHHQPSATRDNYASRDLNCECVRELLDYDPVTGIFRWRRFMNRKAPKGSIAGSSKKLGYREIRIMGNAYQAHRIAWLHVFGNMPVNVIDHVDGDPSNNAIANLREATRTENNRNRHARGFSFIPRDNTFNARIRVDGKLLHLGCFKTEEEARTAYLEATEKYFGRFSAIHSRVAP